MSSLASNTRATTIPCLTYRDARAALTWLCKHLGFAQQAVYEGEHGTIAHAQLTFGNGMVMLGSADPTSEYGRSIRQPDELGGKATQSVCLVSDAPDELYRRVQQGGARILREIRDESYGGRSFICSDPEGHIWCIGSYDPWREAGGA